MLLHSSTTITNSCCFFHSNPNSKDSNPKAAHFLLPKSFFPASRTSSRSRYGTNSRGGVRVTCLLETPVVWAGRLCVFYALLKAGIAGSPSNPIVADLQTGGDGFGFSRWFEELRGKSGEEKEAAARRKLVSKWHPTTKGTLKRNYRVPSKTEGRRLLKAIASLLSDDDHFRDATSHKGCQIRRESAHGESVCCNNVRALFDELPTPHLLVEITPFPAGPLSHTDYSKAEKLERVLRLSPSL